MRRALAALPLALLACGEEGSRPADAALADAATDAGLPRAVPDPMLLPEAIGQTEPGAPPDVAPGASYLDPISGVRIWRVTGPDLPEPNPAAHHDYGNGPTQISHRLDEAGTHTLLVYLDGLGHRLVDFTPGAGLANWRAPALAPGSDVSFTFSNDPATPHLAYLRTAGGALRRLDTRENEVLDGDGFPQSGFGPWLQTDARDEWFVALGTAPDTVIAWNRAAGVRRERTFAGLDEPYLERDGETVLINVGGTASPPLWDLAEDEVRTVTSPTRIFHSASARGYWTAADVDIGGGRVPYYRVAAATAMAEPVLDFDGYQSAFHMAAQWLQGDLAAPPGTDQWILISFYGGLEGGGPLVDRALGFFRLDGAGGFRFLGHSYTSAGGDYWSFPRATISPDGELVMFTSDRGTARTDVFLAEVPVR